MGYRLGVDLGTSYTAATIGRAGSTHGASLGVDAAVVPSLVFIGTDGERLYGSAAAERAAEAPHRVLRGFVRRIGDETPMLPEAGASTAAHRIAADFVAWVVAQASVQEGRSPDTVAVTHPATWGPHKRELFTAALREAGVPGATLVSEPVAAATVGAEGRSHAAGAVVAVYDLGGRTFDAALVRREADGSWGTLGRPAGLPDLGGADLDDLVLGHVVAGLTTEHQQILGTLDADDDATAAAMAGLRAACVQAKEALSTQTTTAIKVALPGIEASVRLTRAEFESMINASIEATVDVLDAVVDGAGLVAGDIDYVLITGGSSRIPLVTQLLSRQFHLPVVTAGGQNPATAIAAGAVLALGEIPAGPAPVIEAAKVVKAASRSVKVSRPARKQAAKAPVVPAPAKPAEPIEMPKQKATHVEVAPAPLPKAPAVEQPVAETPVALPIVEKAPPKPATEKKPVAPAASVEAPVADAPVGMPAIEMPLPDPNGPTSKPIRPRRMSRRSEIVGLEGLTSAPAVRAEVPVVEGPRSVISSRAVASVDALLVEEPVAPVRVARVDDMLPPPRPAMDDAGFQELDEVETEELRASFGWRSVVSFRRSLALTVLTGAIYVGATAWIPATPAITDAPSSSTHVASSAKTAR